MKNKQPSMEYLVVMTGFIIFTVLQGVFIVSMAEALLNEMKHPLMKIDYYPIVDKILLCLIGGVVCTIGIYHFKMK